MCYLVEILYLCSPDRELSYSARVSSCIEIILSIPLAVHTTVTMYAFRTVIFGPFQGSHSSVLRSILLKLHIFTRLIESFPTLHGLCSYKDIEMLIPLGAHALRPSAEIASSAVIF